MLDSVDDSEEPPGEEAVKIVLSAWQLGIRHRVGRCRSQLLDKLLGMVRSDHRVLGPRDDEEWGRIRVDVGAGIKRMKVRRAC